MSSLKCPIRKGLAELPEYMADLPIDDRGYPVPWFVAFIDGKPDFRVLGPTKVQEAITDKVCWVCGKPLEKRMAFVIGPMCSINRTSAEPPSHIECAIFSAKSCPFLTIPSASRREACLPEHEEMPGVAILRNPGCTAVWIVEGYRTFGDGRGGILFNISTPKDVQWFAQGREATRAEVDESVRTGYPILKEDAILDGPESEIRLTESLMAAKRYFPLA